MALLWRERDTPAGMQRYKKAVKIIWRQVIQVSFCLPDGPHCWLAHVHVMAQAAQHTPGHQLYCKPVHCLHSDSTSTLSQSAPVVSAIHDAYARTIPACFHSKFCCDVCQTHACCVHSCQMHASDGSECGADLVQGVNALHGCGRSHTDLKPGNIQV